MRYNESSVGRLRFERWSMIHYDPWEASAGRRVRGTGKPNVWVMCMCVRGGLGIAPPHAPSHVVLLMPSFVRYATILSNNARFGTCRAEICRDHVTGDSLNYAFVEFEAVESCEEV